MKHNTNKSTTAATAKTAKSNAAKNVKSQVAKTADAKKMVASVSLHRTTASGLDRDIVIQSLLVVSVLINLFFFAGYLVIGTDANAAHIIAQLIYNI